MAKILIVDDDELLLGIYANSFRKESFEVLTARDGQEAWDMINGGVVPDIVFTGIIMPRMTGFELIGKIQANSELSKIPVVINSHRGRPEDRKTAESMGVDDFIIQGTTTPVEAVRRVKLLIGVEGKYRVAVMKERYDGEEFVKFMNKKQKTAYEAGVEKPLILEIEPTEGDKFNVKLTE